MMKRNRHTVQETTQMILALKYPESEKKKLEKRGISTFDGMTFYDVLAAVHPRMFTARQDSPGSSAEGRGSVGSATGE